MLGKKRKGVFMEMLCRQCEQAAKGVACETVGVCGKKPDVAQMQDLIVYQTKGIGFLAHALREKGHKDNDADIFVLESLFSTVTNVDFDPARLGDILRRGEEVRDSLRKKYDEIAGSEDLPESATFTLSKDDAGLPSQGAQVGLTSLNPNEDIRSLQELLTYGLKGMAAYADHAQILGKTDDTIFAFFHEALAALNKENPSVDELVGLNMKCGEVNIRTMEILDEAHTDRFGHPEPTEVSVGLRKGPAIVISGHDLLDLEELLKQTEGTGVKVYTHGEMLPAHGYPGLKKYPHLAGHFGTAWQNQQKEFDGAPAAFLFTTNCIQKPRESYKDQVFTAGLVAWPDVSHVENRDFSAVTAKAKELGGTSEDQISGKLTTGFARNAVMNVANTVVDAVKAGAIKHFFLVGGCDGAKPGRNYYTDFVQNTPKDTVVLTLACGKFRFNNLELGAIGGIPRLLDVGQCNDAYSAVKIAQALAQAFGCGVNDLPLSIVLSWYEQKAVVILLSLLFLGIKGIRIGPSLPAFVSPNILNFLVERFDIEPISTPEADLNAILQKA